MDIGGSGLTTMLPSNSPCGGGIMLPHVIEVIGWTAAALMLTAYVLLTAGRLSPRSSMYQILNVLSGAGFIVNSGWNGAYPSAFINVLWVTIGLYGLLSHSMIRSRDSRQPE